MSTYQKLAKYYDRLGWGNYSTWALTVLENILAKEGKTANSILDIACGTGEFLRLHREKFGNEVKLSGLDLSNEMIQIAERKLQGMDIDLHVADMTSFELGKCYDCITCFFDSINYITDEKMLYNAIKVAYSHLTPEGIYIIDINTLYGLSKWNTLSIKEDEKSTLIVSGIYFADKGEACTKIKAFIKSEEMDYYECIEEVHYEKGYKVSDIKRLFNEVGFNKVNVYKTNFDCNFTDDNQPEHETRLYIVGRK